MPVNQESLAPRSLSLRAAAALALLPALATACVRASDDRHAATSAPNAAPSAAATSAIRPASGFASPAAARATTAPLATAAARPASALPLGSSVPAALATAPPSPEGPAILSVTTSASVLHAGDTVVWTVRTTPDVVAVSASTAIVRLDVPKTGPGLFRLPFTIPAQAPGFFHGAYTLAIVGTDADGRSASSSLALDFQ